VYFTVKGWTEQERRQFAFGTLRTIVTWQVFSARWLSPYS